MGLARGRCHFDRAELSARHHRIFYLSGRESAQPHAVQQLQREDHIAIFLALSCLRDRDSVSDAILLRTEYIDDEYIDNSIRRRRRRRVTPIDGVLLSIRILCFRIRSGPAAVPDLLCASSFVGRDTAGESVGGHVSEYGRCPRLCALHFHDVGFWLLVPEIWNSERGDLSRGGACAGCGCSLAVHPEEEISLN